MNRASLRWWTALALIGLAFTLGVAVGTHVTPAAQYATLIECSPQGFPETRTSWWRLVDSGGSVYWVPR